VRGESGEWRVERREERGESHAGFEATGTLTWYITTHLFMDNSFLKRQPGKSRPYPLYSMIDETESPPAPPTLPASCGHYPFLRRGRRHWPIISIFKISICTSVAKIPRKISSCDFVKPSPRALCSLSRISAICRLSPSGSS